MAYVTYDYAGPYPTRERALDALESLFASGEVSRGEFPDVQKRSRQSASWSRRTVSFYITCREYY